MTMTDEEKKERRRAYWRARYQRMKDDPKYRESRRAAWRKYYHNHREKRIAYQKKYAASHPERIREIAREKERRLRKRRQQDPDRLAKYLEGRRRRESTPEFKAKRKAYRERNAAKIKAQQARWRAKNVKRMTEDADYYAIHRACMRIGNMRFWDKKRKRPYSPRPWLRIPDSCMKGDALDRRSMFLSVNTAAAHRYFAMMLAVERKAQRRAR